MGSRFQATTVTMPTEDVGKTIASIDVQHGHFYDLVGRVISVQRNVITYTDGTQTILDGAQGLTYAVTDFRPGLPSRNVFSGAVAADEASKPAKPQEQPQREQVAVLV